MSDSALIPSWDRQHHFAEGLIRGNQRMRALGLGDWNDCFDDRLDRTAFDLRPDDAFEFGHQRRFRRDGARAQRRADYTQAASSSSAPSSSSATAPPIRPMITRRPSSRRLRRFAFR